MRRSPEQMLACILDAARSDERIRAVTMEGSRANPNALHDQYSDFDICWFVTDARDFTRDRSFLKAFGEILILQCPDDWYDHPYDYNGHAHFAYLIQFTDGNRIDLSIRDLRNLAEETAYNEPRAVLLDKDGYAELHPVESEAAYYIRRPGEKEYLDTCNEFRWISIYIAKGLCRQQLYYAKYAYDVLAMRQFIKMLSWKIGIQHNFSVTVGAHGKYFKAYLSPSELARFHGIFSGGDYAEIWEKLFVFYDYFAELAAFTAAALGFAFDETETQKIRIFLKNMRDGL